jgi:hypothetical protein
MPPNIRIATAAPNLGRVVFNNIMLTIISIKLTVIKSRVRIEFHNCVLNIFFKIVKLYTPAIIWPPTKLKTATYKG